ncbi:MAG: hypothetical protein ACI89X_004336 [Planctomycetota bacterium]|jgi:hypothetical protein
MVMRRALTLHSVRASTLALVALLASVALPCQQRSPQRPTDPAKNFFKSAPVLRVAISLSPENRQTLRDRPREYVEAKLAIDGNKKAWPKVGVKLKGAAGSFRKIDERPGFTINLGKFGGTDRLHGLKRFHLNNGAQDRSCLSEWIGGEVFTAAGYPAPRVGHAIVTLDGDLLGLYVLRESFDKRFLLRTVGKTNGSLYDGGFCQDVDRSLDKDSGDGPDDHSDLHRLLDACSDLSPKSTAKLASAIDIDAFIDFMALEAMLAHWDGYSQNRNNFRLWCSKDLGKSQFFPHGMDQLFDRTDASILKHPSAIVANAVQKHPQWRKRYRARLKALLPLFKSRTLNKKIKTRAAKVQRVLKRIDNDLARKHDDAARSLMSKVSNRYRNLQKQVREPEPKPLAFKVGRPIKLDDWNTAGETSGIELKKRSFTGTASLYIGCKSRGQEERRGAYRGSVLLATGKYRVTAMARCQDVEALAGNKGGVRLMAGKTKGTPLLGDRKWTEVSCEFEVTTFRSNVELRLELRALDGKAWFKTSSLLLHRL